jgi:hypothetical protein
MLMMCSSLDIPIRMKLAALIEAIFVVMGEPDTIARQCPLAMDKWEELVVRPVQTMLGLVIYTYQLTVGISWYPKQLRERSFIATQQHLALWKKAIHGIQSLTVDRKARTPHARRNMDFQYSFSSIGFHHICPI